MAVGKHDGDRRSGGSGIPRCMIFLILVGTLLLVSSPLGKTDRHSFSNGVVSDKTACLVCHVEGGELKETLGETVSPPLLDRSIDGKNFEPDGVSKLCISCHDGVVSGQQNVAFSHGKGSALTGDHPVGVVYPPRAANGTLRKNYRALDTRVKLFGPGKNRVSCATCHDPHENGRPAMLRRPVGHRNLCLQCHDL